MAWIFRTMTWAAITLACAFAARAGDLPQIGCYERIYDAAHLKAHKGQFIVKARLEILPASAEQLADKKNAIILNANLHMWVKGKKQSFDTFGACSAQGNVLDCGASISASEEDECKSSKPGVHQCRVDGGDAGGFRVATRPQGLAVSVPGRMELVKEGSDTGPYLNLVGTDRENSDFLLMPSKGDCH